MPLIKPLVVSLSNHERLNIRPSISSGRTVKPSLNGIDGKAQATSAFIDPPEIQQ
jgi:hypothetical protein